MTSPGPPRRALRGVALPAALLLLAVASALALGLADVARTQALLAHSRLDAARAEAAADACLAEAVTALPAGWEFDGALLGPDGVAGTADDGTLPAPAGCAALAAGAPGPSSPPRLLAGVDAVRGGGRRRLEASVGRSARPGVAALVWLADGALPGAVPGNLVLDGRDVDDPAQPPLAALAAPRDPATLDAWIAGEGGHVDVAEAAAPRRAPDLPVAALVARLGGGGAPPGATLAAAGPPPVAATAAPGDLVLAGPAAGAGLLVVGGRLDIQSTFHFNGVVVVGGGLHVGSGGDCTVLGALWLGAPAVGPALVVDGVARVAGRAAAVAQADGLLTLPRPGIVLGIRDGP